MHDSFFKYLSIGKAEEQWGIYVTSVGYSKVEPNDNYPNGKHPESHQLTWNRGRILHDYYIVLISKGKGLFGSSKTSAQEVQAGKCFFLFPEVWHRYKPELSSGWEEYWIGFNGYYVKSLMEKGFFNPDSPFINVESNKEIIVLFHKIIDVVSASALGYHQQLAGMLVQVLGTLNTVSHCNTYKDDPIGRLIAKAEFILQESFETQIDMEEVARQLPMGYSAFRKSFLRVTGQSPNQYHLNLRLNRAKDLLTNTCLNINEVSDQTGFESVFYFSKLFKKKNGLSPKEFRKQTILKSYLI